LSPFTFVIIDENPENAIKTKQSADCFSNLQFLGFAHSYEQAIDLVLKHLPNFIFFEVNSKKDKSNISLHFIDELHRYLTHLPKIIITSNDEHSCFKTIKYGVPAKGMIAWQAQLKPNEMQQVASYIMSLKGTNPPGAKAPQGDLYKDEGVISDSTKTDSTAVNVAVKDSLVTATIK